MSRNATTAGSGNDLAVTHGAKFLAIVEVNTPPVVRELIDAMREQVAFLTPADALMVERLARIVVRLRLIDEYLDRLGGGLIDARGRPRGCWKLYASLEHQFREGPGGGKRFVSSLPVVTLGCKARSDLQTALPVDSGRRLHLIFARRSPHGLGPDQDAAAR
jgi:hypothetical protein